MAIDEERLRAATTAAVTAPTFDQLTILAAAGSVRTGGLRNRTRSPRPGREMELDQALTPPIARRSCLPQRRFHAIKEGMGLRHACMKWIPLAACMGGALVVAPLGLASPQIASPVGKPQPTGKVSVPSNRPHKTIDIVAKVLRFDLAASEDYYSDGHTKSYAATVFEVLSPAHLRARKLVVLLDAYPPMGSPFRAVGKKVRFRIEEENLDPSLQLFSGALSGLTPQD